MSSAESLQGQFHLYVVQPLSEAIPATAQAYQEAEVVAGGLSQVLTIIESQVVPGLDAAVQNLSQVQELTQGASGKAEEALGGAQTILANSPDAATVIEPLSAFRNGLGEASPIANEANTEALAVQQMAIELQQRVDALKDRAAALSGRLSAASGMGQQALEATQQPLRFQ